MRNDDLSVCADWSRMQHGCGGLSRATVQKRPGDGMKQAVYQQECLEVTRESTRCSEDEARSFTQGTWSILGTPVYETLENTK